MTSDNTSAGDEPELDMSTLAAIRNLMVEEPPQVKEAQQEPAAKAEQVAVTPEPPKRRSKADSLPYVADEIPEREAPKKVRKPSKTLAKLSSVIETSKERVVGYRPTVKHATWVAIALIVIFRPWLVVGLVLLTIFILVGVFLILGYDGFWQKAMSLGRWYARRRPVQSATLHKRLDDFAMRWDAILDRFPEGTVDALYMPDFGELAAADARHDAALERRLSSLREN